MNVENKTQGPRRLFGLMYHDVVDSSADAGFRHAAALAYQVDFRAFETHLDALASGLARPVTVFQWAAGAEPNAVLLTFDDGGQSALRAAAALERHGWRGHFFIPTGLIGTAGFLTAKEIRDLHRRGHVIGSHSHTHPNICYNLSRDEMLAEWQRSCAVLSEIVAEPIVAASMPGGDMDRKTVATAATAGIRYLCTSEPTFKPWQEATITCIGRVCVKSGTPLADVRRFVDFKGFTQQMMVRRCKQWIKRFLGPIYSWRTRRSYAGDSRQD